jgi:Tol biopolymer transport system component
MDSARRRRVDDICDAALELPSSDRSAFVASACHGDEALRTEVEALLMHAESVDGFLEHSLGVMAADVMSPDRQELAAGRRLGQYEIVGLIGAGGMGQVYRARDTKLGRDVAIKVIASADPAKADQMARFEREARILAALNHPHIGAIYGLEDIDGIRALVLELVEGKTLAERLAEHRPSLPAALTIARDIAAALEAAHEKGVIHRDLKPANIKITPEGAVKVLDFGLAKVFATEDATGDPARSRGLTFEEKDGVVAGTAGYMSPEQARGAAVNKRTDVWAFGCVLYEMLAGYPAFSGDTRADITAWILERDPVWPALPAATPPIVLRLLRRCLERDSARRLRDIGDARLEIEEALSVAPQPIAQAPAAPKRSPVLWWAVAAALLIGAAAATLWYLQKIEFFWQDPFEHATYRRLTDFDGAEQHAAISRNGEFVVFVSDRETRGVWDAWVRQINATSDFLNLTRGSMGELRNPATRTVGFNVNASQVFLWNRRPDPQKGGLVDAGWVVPTTGVQLPQPYLKMAEPISELDWCRDGTRMVYHPPTGGDPLFVKGVNEDTGTEIFAGQRGQHNHFPVWSPDCRYIYFVKGPPLEKSDVWRIAPVRGAVPEQITFHDSAVSFPTLLDNRTLLYLATDDRGEGPWIYETDVERRIAHRISRGLTPYTSLAASDDGSRLVATESRTTSRLWRLPIADRVVDASGVSAMAVPTTYGMSPRSGPGFMTYRAPRAGLDAILKVPVGGGSQDLWIGMDGRPVSGAVVSPDARRVAFVVRREKRLQLHVANADGSGVRRLGGELEVSGEPAWSPDGLSVLIGVSRGGQVSLFKFPVDAGTPALFVEKYSTDPTWSPSGEFVVYTDEDTGTLFSIRAVNKDGSAKMLPETIKRLTRGARRMAFLDEHHLVIMRGNVSCRDFWILDLRNGTEKQLSNLGCAFEVQDFDIAAKGREIIFSRRQEESDIVLIERRLR